jgi:hypothetical protein
MAWFDGVSTEHVIRTANLYFRSRDVPDQDGPCYFPTYTLPSSAFSSGPSFTYLRTGLDHGGRPASPRVCSDSTRLGRKRERHIDWE